MAGDVVGKAVYDLETDSGKVTSGLKTAEGQIKSTGAAVENAFARQGTAAVAKLDKASTGMFGRWNDLSKRGGLTGALMGGVGLGVGLGAFGLITKGVSMVTDAIGDSIKAASDMAETQGKLDVVFGDNADTLRAWAETAASSMGISKQAALEAAGTFGNFLQAMGTVPAAAARMSSSIVTLASDLASFNNSDPAEVLLALRSGLSGEVEPMRKFGVDLSAAAVTAELMRQGVNKVGKEFAQTDKIQARYTILMRQTTSAQGDYLRTADGLANSQRSLNAEIADSEAEIGAKLMPVFLGLVRILKNDVVPFILEVVKGIDNIGDAVNNLVRAVNPDFAAIQDAADALRDLATQAGYTEEGLHSFVKTGLDSNLTLDDMRAELQQTVDALKNQMDPALRLLIFNWKDMGGTVHANQDQMRTWSSDMLAIKDLVLAHWSDLPADMQAVLTRWGLVAEVEGDHIGMVLGHGIDGALTWVQTGLTHANDMMAAALANKAGYDKLLADRQAAADKASEDAAAAHAARVAARFAGGITERLKTEIPRVRKEVDDFTTEILSDLRHPQRGLVALAEVEGLLLSKKLGDMIASPNAVIRQRGLGIAQQVIGEYEKLSGKTWDYGQTINENLGHGLKGEGGKGKGGGKNHIPNAAKSVADNAAKPLIVLSEKARTYGTTTGQMFALGLLSSKTAAALAGASVAQAAADALEVHSPAKIGPFSRHGGPEGMGRIAGSLYARGLLSGLSGMSGSLGSMALDTSSTRTVRHEGTVRLELSPATIGSMRQAGYSGADIGAAAAGARGSMDVTALLNSVAQSSGTRYVGPRRY